MFNQPSVRGVFVLVRHAEGNYDVNLRFVKKELNPKFNRGPKGQPKG